MTDKPTPTDAELKALWQLHAADIGGIFDFARAVLAKWGTTAPVGVGEAAEHYRNAIARACEGWTMPDGLRKHLETALWSPPTPQPTQPQAGAVPLTDEYPALVCDYCGALTPDPWHSSGMLHGKMSKHIHSCDACASHGQAPVNPDTAYSAACNLATALFKKHFAHLPDFASGQAAWSLCDSTAGVISQIDNMVAGLVQPPTISPQAADTGAAAPLLDYAMQIAHERELRVTGNAHDEDGAKLRFEAAMNKGANHAR